MSILNRSFRSLLVSTLANSAHDFDPITGMRLTPRDPFVCFVEGDPPGTPPAGEPPPKTFTQAELDAIVQKRVGELNKKFGDYDAIKEQAAKAAEHEKELADLKEKLELAGKSEAEKAKLLAEKMQVQQQAQLAALTKERDEAKAAAEQRAKALEQTQVRYQATAALSAAKALPSSMKHATALFVAEAKIESVTDETTGEVTVKSIEVDGIPYADVTKAAEAWLKLNPWFAAAPAGGGDTRSPNGMGGGKSFDQMSSVDLAEIGLTNALSKR